MTSEPRKPHWEIVRTDAGWHVRFRANNGHILLSSEVYTDRRRATRCITLTAGADFHQSPFQDHLEIPYAGDLIEVRELDERGASS